MTTPTFVVTGAKRSRRVIRTGERCRLRLVASLTMRMRIPSVNLVGAWRNGGARALGVPGTYAG